MIIIRRGIIPPAAGGGNFDADTNTWAAQVVTNGGSVSDTSKGYVDTLIKAIKASSNLGPNLNSKLDRLWLVANFDNNEKQSLTSIINPASGLATKNGSFTVSNSLGWQGDGSSGYWDSNYNVSTGGGNYSLDSASVFTYGLTSRTTTATECTAGWQSAGSVNFCLLAPYDTSALNGVNTLAAALFVGPNHNARGFTILTRTGANSSRCSQYYSDTSFTVTDTSASNAVASLNMHFFAENFNGTAATFSNDKLALAGLGGGLTTSAMDDLAAAVNTYMTSLGIQVAS